MNIIIHQSSKLFWKHKCTLDFIIVDHNTFDVFELRAYESVVNKESEPVFIDRSAVLAMVTDNDVESAIRELKEPILRRKEVPNDQVIAAKARNQVIAELILNRTFIQEYSIEKDILSMTVVNTVMDIEKGRPQLSCARPPGLTPFSNWNHGVQNTPDEVNDSIEGLNNEVKGIQKSTTDAAKYQETARSLLSVRERWRIALVFGKVSRGKRLSLGDKKIWQAVSQNPEVQDMLNATSNDSNEDSSSRPRRRSRPTPLISPRRSPSSRNLTPREAVASQIQPSRGYSVLDSGPPTLNRQNSFRKEGSSPLFPQQSFGGSPRRPSNSASAPTIGLGVDGLTNSLESSLAAVPGQSMDVNSKHHRSAASLDYEEPGVPVLRRGSSISRPQSPMRTVPSEDANGSESGRGIGITSSRSSSTSHRRGSRGAKHSVAVEKEKEEESPQKSRYRKRSVVESGPTACEVANQQLVARRMLKALAKLGSAVGESIRSSFSGSSKVKVHVLAAQEAVARAEAMDGDALPGSDASRVKPSSSRSRTYNSTTSSINAGSRGGSFLGIGGRASLSLGPDTTPEATRETSGRPQQESTRKSSAPSVTTPSNVKTSPTARALTPSSSATLIRGKSRAGSDLSGTDAVGMSGSGGLSPSSSQHAKVGTGDRALNSGSGKLSSLFSGGAISRFFGRA